MSPWLASTSVFEALPDEEVVHLARGGMHQATEFLLARYRPLIEHKARAYFVRGADKEDVIQEGMIGLYKAIRDYQKSEARRFKPFAEMCVTRQIISAVKAATRNKHEPLNGSISLYHTIGEEAADITLIDVIPDPGSIASADRTTKGLAKQWHARAYEKFSDLERRVLERYLDGKTYREIGAELNCHTKCIDNALQRVKKKICTLLRESSLA